MIIGFTTGVFDLFHIGHLNLFRNAKAMCDKLIVSVYLDEVVTYKQHEPLIPFNERCEIIRSIRYVDKVVPQETMDKFQMWNQFKFDLIFVGDDWFETERYNKLEKSFTNVGVKIVYFPYSKRTSSSLISNTILGNKFLHE